MILIDVAVLVFIFYLFFLALSKISDSVFGETVYYQHREEHIPDDQHFHQGYFFPNNPGKYRGDPENIIYRSGWERIAFQYCDSNPRVIAWASEERFIPYYMRGSRYTYRYYPDLLIYYDSKETVMVEIKPKKERLNPSLRNQCKWAAACAYCRDRDWQFRIWTEDTIEKIRKK